MTDLLGARVVVTRAVDQADELIEAISAAGGLPVLLPLLEIAPPPDRAALRQALDDLDSGSWLAVLSPNGARSITRTVPEPTPARVAAVGSATARVLEAAGWAVDLVAPTATAQSLADSLVSEPATRCLVVQAAGGRPTLVDGLREQGWSVEVAVGYVNRVPDIDPDAVESAARADVVVFASPSAVERYRDVLGNRPTRAVAIGPVTGEAASAAGFETLTAEAPTVSALVDALASVVD